MPTVNCFNKTTMTPMAVLDPNALVGDKPDTFMASPDLSIIKNVDRAYWKVENDTLLEMDQTEKDAVDASRLPALKVEKAQMIDARTRVLVSEGYDHDSRHFSMSDKAQATLNSMAMEARMNSLSYPATVSADDADIEYEVADAPELRALYVSFRTKLRQRLQSGRNIKKDIRDAATKAVLDAIVDPR